MKYYESTFEEYVQSVKIMNYHPYLNSFQDIDLASIPNTIYYGPSGVGKYSQVLYRLSKHSPSHLKYQKKMKVSTEKGDYSFSFSDVHYEVDMGLLGCNAKIIWEALYQQIVDIVSVKTEKVGVLVCCNFHQIHSELLDIFFLYFKQYQQTNNILFNKNNIVLKYILLTEHVSFLPNSFIHSCHLISVPRPSKQLLFMGKSSDIRKKAVSLDLRKISNLKEIHRLSFSSHLENMDLFQKVCEPLVQWLSKPYEIDILKVRECLYNISIYQLDFMDCLWYLLRHVTLSRQKWGVLLHNTSHYLKFYNNNYRTIYHFENIFYSLVSSKEIA